MIAEPAQDNGGVFGLMELPGPVGKGRGGTVLRDESVALCTEPFTDTAPIPMLRKVLNVLIVSIAVAVVLPIPLALWVDMTYHWLLLVTIPFGVPLLTGMIIWRVVLGAPEGGRAPRATAPPQ